MGLGEVFCKCRGSRFLAPFPKKNMPKTETPKTKRTTRKPKAGRGHTLVSPVPRPRRTVLTIYLPGIISAVLITIISILIFINQQIKLESEISLDSHHLTQGENSLRWQFEIQPTMVTCFNKAKEVGCYLHLEVRPDSGDNISGIDLREFKEIIFSAKTNITTLMIDEFNMFIGKEYIHFYYINNLIPIETVWKDYYINLGKFDLARWDNRTKEHEINDRMDVQNVVAFGLDLKTDCKPKKGKLWIDNVRLVAKNGQIILISDCDNLVSIFQGKRLQWISGANEYIIK